MSTDRLVEQPGKSKIVVLLTDGMNNAGKANPEVAADAARLLGVSKFTPLAQEPKVKHRFR